MKKNIATNLTDWESQLAGDRPVGFVQAQPRSWTPIVEVTQEKFRKVTQESFKRPVSSFQEIFKRPVFSFVLRKMLALQA